MTTRRRDIRTQRREHERQQWEQLSDWMPDQVAGASHAIGWHFEPDDMPPVDEPVWMDLACDGICWGCWTGQQWRSLVPGFEVRNVVAWSYSTPAIRKMLAQQMDEPARDGRDREAED